MKLGIHYHIPATSIDSHIYLPAHFGRFIDSLAKCCELVVCFLHSPRDVEEFRQMDYRILSDNVRLVNIGVHTSVMERSLKSKTYTSYLHQYAHEIDILLIRGPSPLLPAMVNASPVPTALLLVGSYVAGVNDLPQPLWRKEAIRLWSYWNEWGQKRAARHSLIFVNSRILYNELIDIALHLYEIQTTTLTKDDFFIRSDTCQTKPYQLLYTGRMDRSKGLLQIVKAVSLLIERGEDIELNLVGPEQRGDTILEEIMALVKDKKIEGRIQYLGSRPLGPELLKFYRHADIFVTASLASEGFPRTIWEAMANSLPVIASKVGSIPAFIEGAAELVEPRSPGELAKAISRLIYDKKRRCYLIQQGRKLAMENTLENRAREMTDIINTYLSATKSNEKNH